MDPRFRRTVFFSLIFVTFAIAVLTASPESPAFEAKSQDGRLQDKEFFREELYISSSNVQVGLTELQQRSGSPAVDRFLDENGDDFNFFMDPRSGTLTAVIGSVPLIPGSGVGNAVKLADLEGALGRAVVAVEPPVVGDLAQRFVVRNAAVIGIDVTQLGPTRAVQVSQDLWHIRIPQVVDGIPVRHGHMVATINHGNLVLLGTETWGNVVLDTQPTITDKQALEIGFAYAGGKEAADEMWREADLEIIPYAPQQHQDGNAFVGPVGEGYRHRLVWTFGFSRPPGLERWEVLVDAHSGEMISFEDKNHYAEEQVVGGIYPLTSTEICPTNETCGTMQDGYPMPFAYTGLPAPNDVTNSAGLYDYTGGTVTFDLTGPFLTVNDNCGTISESTTTGPLDFGGVNGDHDCTSAGASPGDTSASRSCFYELNKIIELAKGWLPTNTWLQSPLTANVNVNNTCNAIYTGSVNFYKSGGGCRNTGEIAAVFDHEWGHGMDDHDSGGSMSVSSEAYADIAAIYRLHASCVGHGFWHTQDKGCGMTSDGTGFNGNESRSGTHCDVDCSGVRDADWALHEDGIPDTPQNFACVHCQTASGGPCGGQVHCDAAPSRQAAWDLVARDLRDPPFSYDKNSAFIIGNRLFYQGSGNIGSWHTCTCPNTSGGCGASNAYMQWLAVDDDNGDINDGTPHMTALHAAFARHNIACDTPAPVDSGCAGGPTGAPTLAVSIGSHELGLDWTAVPDAVEYRVFRTEGHAGCDFGKTLIATVTETSYLDTEVANGRDYSYVVQAVGSSESCFGPVSVCETAAPQPCAGSIRLDRQIYNCDDSIGIVLVDADLIGAGMHDVTVLSESEPAGETVTLVESPPASGRFVGTFLVTDAPAAGGDGAVTVSHGDTIDVQYLDVSYCGTPDVSVQESAPVDCAAPVISNVQVSAITGDEATISWDTSELSDSVVTYGELVPGATVATEAMTTAHSIKLDGLAECTVYLFSVSSTDQAQNTATDDNLGEFHEFATGVNNEPEFDSTDTPIAIVDNTTFTSVITVEEDETVLDVDVRINATHTYTGDLDIFLIGPDDTRVELTSDNGGSGNDFIDTIFDDEATTPITGGSAPFTGRYQPEGSLATLDGLPATGTWTLEVTDDAGADQGQLTEWTLILTFEARQCGPVAEFLSHQYETDACSTGSAGVGNNRWEVGEQIEFSLTVKNDGTDPVNDAVVNVTPITPGIVMLDDTATVGDLDPGISATTQPPHVIAQLTDALICGQTVEFQVDTVSNEGSWPATFQQLIGEVIAERSGVTLAEDFATGIPAEWTVIDGSTDGFTWYADDAGDPAGCGSANPAAPIAGPWAAVDSSCTGGGDKLDEQLISPLIDFTDDPIVTLEFDHWFEFSTMRRDEVADVDVRSSLTGQQWVNVARWTAASTANPEHAVIDITAQAGDATNVQIRWHYYNAQADLYWYVDNVVVHFFAPEICLNEVCAAPSTTPPPVPDGSGASSAMQADRLTPDGSEISVTWDDQCAPTSTKIVYGPLGQVSDYTISGSVCGILNPETWTGVPGGNLWFVVMSDDGVSVESSWGHATDGERNGLTPSNTCGATAKEITGTCP
jgi:uncharacterized repeat protein (TIGR01451 family)